MSLRQTARSPHRIFPFTAHAKDDGAGDQPERICMRFNIHLFIYDLTLWNIFTGYLAEITTSGIDIWSCSFFTDHFCGGFSSHVVMSDISTDFGISPSTRPPVIIIIFFPSRIFDETPAISSLFCMKSPFSFAKHPRQTHD